MDTNSTSSSPLAAHVNMPLGQGLYANEWVLNDDKIYIIKFEGSKAYYEVRTMTSLPVKTTYTLTPTGPGIASGRHGTAVSEWIYSIVDKKLNLCIDDDCKLYFISAKPLEPTK